MSISVPPEWARHKAIWTAWPSAEELWGEDIDPARAEVAAMVHALHDGGRGDRMRVLAQGAAAVASAKQALGDAAEVIEGRFGDIWFRDTGPIFTAGGAAAFRFNGWGGKYLMPGDTETAGAVAAHESLPATFHDIVLEGGAIDADGTGRLLTTRQCLLNPNRNPDLTAAEIEARICAALGIEEMIWLGDGLLNDHTDGHVDNIARFIGPGHALCQMPSGADDPNTDVLLEIEATLRDAGLDVTTIPSPGLILGEEGEPIPASHMNFTITNGAVLVPVYEDHYSLVALAEMRVLFPGRRIIGLPAGHILGGGGSFHCMTREIPA